MEPAICDGEVLLVAPDASVTPGDIVVCGHPTRNIDVVKELGSVDTDGRLVLVSPQGDDSGSFGTVDSEKLRGRVTVSLTRRRLVQGSALG